MDTKELGIVVTEVNEVIENMEVELQNRIPQDVKEKLKELASKEHIFKYDKTKTLNEQNLHSNTKEIIAWLYREYIATKEEREKYDKYRNKYLEELEKKKREKYNLDNLFDKNDVKQENMDNINTLPEKYKKATFLNKIISKIKVIFNK